MKWHFGCFQLKDKYLEEWVLYTMLRLCLDLKETAKLVFQSSWTIFIPSSNAWDLLLSYYLLCILTSTGYCAILNFNHFNTWVVISNCCFNLQIPYDMMLNVFICLVAIRVSSLGRCLLRLVLFSWKKKKMPFFPMWMLFFFILFCRA